MAFGRPPMVPGKMLDRDCWGEPFPASSLCFLVPEALALCPASILCPEDLACRAVHVFLFFFFFFFAVLIIYIYMYKHLQYSLFPIAYVEVGGLSSATLASGEMLADSQADGILTGGTGTQHPTEESPFVEAAF